MSTEKHTRARQSRINGAKSRGPATPEGKARSAVNNTRHGMYSSRVCLDNENPALYALLLHLYNDLLMPADIVETDLVESMVNARWRIRRLESSQTANMNLTLAEHRREFTKAFGPTLDPAMEQALTFRALTKEAKAFDTLIRFEERLHRTYERSYRLLLHHRRKSGKALPSAAELRHIEAGLPANDAPTPEPTPAPEPPPQPAPQNEFQKERFEPEQPPNRPSNPKIHATLAKIAVLAVLVYTLFAAFHQGRGRGVAFPSVMPMAHFTASSHIFCTSGRSQASSR